MKTKLFLIFVLGMFLIGMVNAENIGTFKQNQEMQIVNYCSTGDCTYANLTSIISPFGVIQNINSLMTKEGNNFNYSYTPTELGSYTFNTCSNPNGIIVCERDTFEVTPNGDIFSTGEGILYAIILLILFGVLCSLIYFAFGIDGEDYRDDDGWIGVNLKKYLRILLISIIYPVIIIILNLMNALAIQLSGVTQFSGIIGFLFETMLRGAIVWTIMIVGWVIYSAWRDSKIKEMVNERLKNGDY